MKSLGKFLDAKYQEKHSVRLIDEKTIFFLAKKIMEDEYGKKGASSVVPQYFSGGKLFFSGKSGLWVEEISLFRKEFLCRINEMIGTEYVKDIKISHEFSR